MSARIDSKARALAKGVLRLAVRAWPSESREWGQAIEAEIDLAEGGSGALWWALGGIVVFTRRFGKAFGVR